MKIMENTLSYFRENITRTDNDKTKTQYLLERRGDWKPEHKPEYMNKLIRNQLSITFQG